MISEIRLNRNQTLTAAIVILIWSNALAALPLFPKCNDSAFQRNVDLIRKIAIIGEENRLVIEEYARANKMTVAQAKKKFAATGVIFCTTGKGTVQLTGKNNIITTSGHIFYRRQCNRTSEDRCKIRFPYSRSPEKVYKIKKGSLVTGPCTIENNSFNNDWAVLELTEAVPEVKPYKAPPRSYIVDENTKVLQVAASTINFKVNDQYPFNLNECYVRRRNHDRYHPLKTDCDSGGWASGAAQLIEKDGELTLAAIHLAEVDSNNQQPGRDFDPYYHFNVSRGVEGDFLEAIYEKLDGK